MLQNCFDKQEKKRKKILRYGYSIYKFTTHTPWKSGWLACLLLLYSHNLRDLDVNHESNKLLSIQNRRKCLQNAYNIVIVIYRIFIIACIHFKHKKKLVYTAWEYQERGAGKMDKLPRLDVTCTLLVYQFNYILGYQKEKNSVWSYSVTLLLNDLCMARNAIFLWLHQQHSVALQN